jgi:hypothetical protein
MTQPGALSPQDSTAPQLARLGRHGRRSRYEQSTNATLPDTHTGARRTADCVTFDAGSGSYSFELAGH